MVMIREQKVTKKMIDEKIKQSQKEKVTRCYYIGEYTENDCDFSLPGLIGFGNSGVALDSFIKKLQEFSKKINRQLNEINIHIDDEFHNEIRLEYMDIETDKEFRDRIENECKMELIKKEEDRVSKMTREERKIYHKNIKEEQKKEEKLQKEMEEKALLKRLAKKYGK